MSNYKIDIESFKENHENEQYLKLERYCIEHENDILTFTEQQQKNFKAIDEIIKKRTI